MSNKIDNKISEIDARNKRVEMDKKWETSLTRKLTIAIVTYGVASLYMSVFLNDPHWYLGAFIPTGGYVLSTLSLPFVRKLWQKDA